MSDDVLIRMAPNHLGHEAVGVIFFRTDEHHDGTTTLTIEHADPRIVITDELLSEIAAGNSRFCTLRDGVLRIEGTNRTVVYRIGEYRLVPNVHYAEWPD